MAFEKGTASNPFSSIFGSGTSTGKYSPSNPAPIGKGAGVLTPANGGGVIPTGGAVTAPTGPKLRTGTTTTTTDSPSTGGGGGDGGYAAAMAKANSEAKDRSRRQNEATRSLVDQQHALLGAFGKQRDIKLSNVANAMKNADALLLKNYNLALGGLEGSRKNNEMAEADASFSNITNALRERSSISEQAMSQGAGETDLMRSQLQAIRNYNANQGEVNRSFYDTLQSINNSVTSLNSDTMSGRTNIFNQAESDREAIWSNYNNQMADTWTQIGNIENSNTNTASDSSEEYKKKYVNAGDEARKATQGGYKKVTPGANLTNWSGMGKAENRELTSSNRAASINLGGPQKKPEGATLRKW